MQNLSKMAFFPVNAIKLFMVSLNHDQMQFTNLIILHNLNIKIIFHPLFVKFCLPA